MSEPAGAIGLADPASSFRSPGSVYEIEELSFGAVGVHEELPPAAPNREARTMELELARTEHGVGSAVLPEERLGARRRLAEQDVAAIESPSRASVSGTSTPAKRQNVGDRSIPLITLVVSVIPAGMIPFQRAMKGMRMPPSKSDHFRPKNGSGRPGWLTAFGAVVLGPVGRSVVAREDDQGVFGEAE